jgi:hypothetical protein
MANKIFSGFSILIGVVITTCFFSEFTILYHFDLVALIRVITSGAFFVFGVGIFLNQIWAKIGFLVLLGLNAVLSLQGLYLFSFPLDVAPNPRMHIQPNGFLIQYSLIYGWIPFILSLYFLILKKEIRRR